MNMQNIFTYKFAYVLRRVYACMCLLTYPTQEFTQMSYMYYVGYMYVRLSSIDSHVLGIV